MRHKIKFYCKKMEISVIHGEITHYYSDLMYVKYNEPYCYLHFTDDTKHKVEISLKYLWGNLPMNLFFRCNRATIINICYYKRYQKRPPILVMEDDAEFRLSLRNIADFKKQKAIISCISPPCIACKNENCQNRISFVNNTN